MTTTTAILEPTFNTTHVGRVLRLAETLAPLAQAQGLGYASLFRLTPQNLRFRLGTTLHDLRVPYALDSELRQVVRRAAKHLVSLVLARHRHLLNEEVYFQLKFDEVIEDVQLRPKRYRMAVPLQNAFMRSLIESGPEALPTFDVGLLTTWLGTGGHGRAFMGHFLDLFNRAVGESHEGGEPLPMLLFVFLAGDLVDCVRQVSAMPLTAAASQVCLGALASAFPIAVNCAVESARKQHPAQTSLRGGAGMGLALVEALANPFLMFPFGAKNPSRWVLGPYNPYRLAPPLLGAIAERAIAALDQGADPTALVARARTVIEGDGALRANVVRAQTQSHLQALALELLRLSDSNSGDLEDLPTLFANLHADPPELLRLIDGDDRKPLLKKLEGILKRKPPKQVADLLGLIAEVLKRYNPKSPESYFAKELPQAIEGAARSSAAFVLDVVAGRALGDLRACVTEVKADESKTTHDYQSGQLYFVGTKDQPFLNKSGQVVQMGHMFVDLKDFTRRTALMKETVMADFLQREFYEPLVTAAKDLYMGMDHLGDRGNIYLNNLLGDAMSLSGGISGLVELARRFRKVLNNYRERLNQQLDDSLLRRHLEDAEREHHTQRDAMMAAVEQLRAKVTTAEQELGGDAAALAQAKRVLNDQYQDLLRDLRRLEETYQDNRESIAGKELEAGLFISFGASPRIIQFNNDVWGEMKVSIAEKINESARGTARDGAVLTKIHAIRDRLKQMTPDNAYEEAFRVYVDSSVEVKLELDEELLVRRGAMSGDQNMAREGLVRATARFIQDLQNAAGNEESLRQLMDGRRSLYNAGDAVSGEALQAYMDATKSSRAFLRRHIRVDELHPDIRKRFFFPRSVLQLVLGYSRQSGLMQELFAYAGSIVFKGFERREGVAIYEMVDKDSAFFEALARLHASSWAADLYRVSAGGETPPSNPGA